MGLALCWALDNYIVQTTKLYVICGICQPIVRLTNGFDSNPFWNRLYVARIPIGLKYVDGVDKSKEVGRHGPS